MWFGSLLPRDTNDFSSIVHYQWSPWVLLILPRKFQLLTITWSNFLILNFCTCPSLPLCYNFSKVSNLTFLLNRSMDNHLEEKKLLIFHFRRLFIFFKAKRRKANPLPCQIFRSEAKVSDRLERFSLRRKAKRFRRFASLRFRLKRQIASKIPNPAHN